MDRRVRLVVLFGGRSAEHDVSCVSARHVLAAADPERYLVEPIGITREGKWVRSEDAVAALGSGVAALPDQLSTDGPAVDALPLLAEQGDERVVVMPILHGPMGEDGTVQGLLDIAEVPYVGAGVLASALCMDKVIAKQLTEHHGIPQGRYLAVRDADITEQTPVELLAELGPIVFVKPANLGSSVGVSKADTPDALGAALELAARYDEWIVVEEAIAGREIEVAVLGNREIIASAPGEIRPNADFYDYADKYLDGAAELLIPAPLDDDETAAVRALAVRAAEALRVEGLARVDFFYEEDGRGFLLNEVNTMPGFTPISMYPQLWQATGISYPKLIDELIALAIERHDRRLAHRSVDR